jgi:homoserine dehydrogenase
LKKCTVALVGLGIVGTGLLQAYKMNYDKIENQIGSEIDFKYVVDLDLTTNRGVDLTGMILTSDFNQVIADPEVDVIVELIGGLSIAVEFIKRALKSGKHVVTANKAAIATFGPELRALARENNVILRYEASVGGGIPVLNTLAEKLIANQITDIVGILNGTTNYILTRMTEEGLEFEEALKLAQEAGFAEANPSSDINGTDSCYKLCILAHKVFGLTVDPQHIPTVGINNVSKEDIDYAKELGFRIKLLASAHKIDSYINLRVNPCLVRANHPLASVNAEFNAFFIKGNALGDIMLYGKGAGGLPTGSAVLGDIIDVYKGNAYPRVPEINAQMNTSSFLRYYIRLEVIDAPGVLGKVAALFGQHDISLESVVQRAKVSQVVPLVFITHVTEKSKLDAAIEEITAYDKVVKVASIMSVEE